MIYIQIYGVQIMRIIDNTPQDHLHRFELTPSIADITPFGKYTTKTRPSLSYRKH